MCLSGYEIKKIRKALKSAYPRRDRLIIMLREEIDIDESEVPQDSDYDIVLSRLITNFEIRGNIQELINGARKGNSGNYCLQKLSITIDAFKKLAPFEEKYLEKMKQSYLACCPKDWHINQNTDTAHDLEEILDNLEDMPQGSNLYSRTEQFVARFLVDVENKLHPEEFNKLKEWGEQSFENFSELLLRKDEKKTSKEQETIPNHLIIYLDSSKQQKKRYFVSAWFIPDGANEKFNHLTGEGYKFLEIEEQEQETFTLEQIPSLLEDYLDKITPYLTDFSSQPTIEIFLPYELLNEPIDTWRIQKELAIPIGSLYKVIVRSSYRLLKEYRYRNVWVQKWKILKELTENACSECCTSGDCHSWQELFSRLNQESAIALKLLKPPSKEFFQVMNQTAIPVALWIRQELQNSHHQVQLDELLTCSITELPERVKRKRSDDFPYDSEQRIGHHLSLLWENPHILPPQIKYTTPS
ncbi:effector-associated domain EAD1-containing protein [Scytonema sp. PCC 10023]|uniref:VMAP-C domain-containing protein n=1 Tax=Scytonema sp. PCC 10023 TaxID=1680591 RepID=UPI0039C6C5D5